MKAIWMSKTPAPKLGLVLGLFYLFFIAWRAWDQASASSLFLLLVWLVFISMTVMFRWRYPQRLILDQEQLVLWVNAWPNRIPVEQIYAVQIHRFSKPTAILRAQGLVQIEYRGGFGVARAHFQDAQDLDSVAAELQKRFPNQVQQFHDHLRVPATIVEQSPVETASGS